MTMVNRYDIEVEDRMKIFYDSLSEKDKRRYAAVESMKLPYGGQSYISEILECDPKTIQQGLSELSDEEAIKKNE